jgi:prophage DNA circulation protein
MEGRSMTWREDLLPATLGGVVFRYREVRVRHGQRKITHEYYGPRKATIETIGPETYRATIDAYIVGDNYLVQKNRLLAVINGKGPWEFVHPYQGSIMVEVEPVDLSESVAEQGMVRIGQLSLVEAGLDYPAIFDATSSKVSALAAAAAEAMVATSRLTFVGMIDSVLDSVAGGISKATSKLAKVNNRVQTITGSMAQVQAALNLLSEQRSYVTQTPRQILGGLIGIGMAAFNALGRYDLRRTITVEEPTWGTVACSEAAIHDLATFETDASDVAQGAPEGPQLLLAEQAHAEVQLQMQTLAFVAGASIAGELPYESAVQASKMMQILAQGLSASMAAPGLPASARNALADLKVAVVRHLLEQQAALPRVVKIPVPSAMPAIVLAYEIHGDPERAHELYARNRGAGGRPGAVPGGTELEVVVDG